jgi:hypothetical protein
MNHTLFATGLFTILWFSPMGLRADGELWVDQSPSALLPEWLQIGAQIRGRFESPSGTSLANSSRDSYYASRIRVDLGVKPCHWLKLFAQAQDARVGGYSQPTAPTTLYNPMDLRQGYIQVSGEGSWGEVQLRAGRQELAFGGERLIGPADWGMSRTFDALDLTLKRGPAKVDFFAGSSVLIDSTRFDRHKPGEHFYGAYGSIGHLLPGMTIEPYILCKQTLLVKSETGVVGNSLVSSPGARIAGKTPARFDYVAEVVEQWGSYSKDKVRAFGQSYVAGWTMADSDFKPRVSTEYSYASGDANPKDGVRGTFDQFYPSNHGYYGMIDQFGWKNLKNRRAGFDCVPWKKVKLRTDFNEFYLATAQDALYGSSGSSVVLNRNATSNHIGSEVNTTALYQWTKIWKFGAGYGRLFAGKYLKQSKADFSYTYPYVMFVGDF